MKDKIQAAARAYNDARERLEASASALEQLAEDAEQEAVDAAQAEFDAAETDVVAKKAEHDRLLRVEKARETHKPLELADGQTPKVGAEEPVYRQDGSHSFFSDLYRAQRFSDPDARARLERNQAELRADVTSADPGAAGYIPPIYLAELAADLARPGRKFADNVPSFPFPPSGLTVTIPKVQTGVTEAVQANENDAVSETDIDTQTVTASMVTIAGQNDISRQALERSFPGMDVVIYRDLLGAYDAKLDTQLLAGAGSSGEHRGIRNVSGKIAVAYTDASPTQAECLGQIYNAVSQVASQRYAEPTVIVMHPRRAAWLAAGLSSTFPLFQQGGLMQAVGTQDNGFAGMLAGLPVITDANIGTTYGASTNEDEIYVLYLPDVLLAEGPVRQATYEDVLSGTLTVRLQLFAYSFFVPHRQAKSVAVISGTGLVTPSF